MACHICHDSKRYKGLPCPSCEITARERSTIRDTIYYGEPWRSKFVAAKLGKVRPMIELIVDAGFNVMDNRGEREQAVLRSDLRLVMKTKMLHVKPGTTVDRVYAELDGIVEEAARARGLVAKVVTTSGSGVIEGVGVETSSVDSVQDQRRATHLQKAGLSNNMELINALAKLRPAVFVCIYTDHVVSGARQQGREGLQAVGQILAPGLTQVTGQALPGQTTTVPWLLYRVEIPEDIPNGIEFHLAAEKYHYRPAQFEQGTTPLVAKDLFKGSRDITSKPLLVQGHGPCPDCTAIANDQTLRGFEQAISAASVVPGETHGHACDRVMAELMEKFRTIERR